MRSIMMSVLNSILALPLKVKLIILATIFVIAISIPTIYALSKEEPKLIIEGAKADIIGDVENSLPKAFTSDDEDGNFVMQEDFFQAGSAEDDEEPKNRNRKKKRNEKQAEDRWPQDSWLEVAQPKKTVAAIVEQPVFEAKNIFLDPPVRKKSSPRKRPTSKPSGNEQASYINYEEDDSDSDIAELLADKDYPNSNAGYPHDLSRILTTDTFIPAVIYTALNSEIPSKTVLAVVESDVVGFHGNNILIPKGSKVEGVYEKLDSKHARRMQITWFKITRPDGMIIKLDGESGDMQGAGGLGGYLDQRLKDRYGGAILLSTINALAQMSVKENSLQQMAAVDSFGREFSTLTAQIIRENMNVMPIIMIRQGTRFNIRPYQNIYFPKAKNKVVKALFIN